MSSTQQQQQQQQNENFPKMTKKSLRAICKKHDQYMTPELNDILYLHFQGFSKIENLDEYVGLKCLWLESNGISKIENISHFSHLKCLYLQNNLIEEIENLCELTELDTLCLSNNSLTKLQNLSPLTKLHTLQVSHNYFQSADDIMELKLCLNLGVLDLQHNRIDDTSVVDIFSQMPSLGVLTLQGNPVVNKIKFYRKKMICCLATLKYLDDRPVFDKDRSAALAWERGGLEAEREERRRWAKVEQEKILASVDALRNIRESHSGNQVADQSNERDFIGQDSDTDGGVECEDTARVLSSNIKMDDDCIPPLEPISATFEPSDKTEPFLVTELPLENAIEEIDLTNKSEVIDSIFSNNTCKPEPTNPLLFDFNQSEAREDLTQSRQPFLIQECEEDSSTFQTKPPVVGVKQLITEIGSDSVNEPEPEPTRSSDFIEYFDDLKGVSIATTALDRNEIVSLDTQECDNKTPYEPPPSEVIQNLAELIGSTSGNMECEL
eukprot:TRINITY_DN758_c0_g2_i1.p1 TRINITY_DN758_c0_g2~~TRINITY_DN758_c0_g2_i1.p1  ORF type:complete len:495 (+),score=104.40 TRINITY_DN758_c0_g2_i1:131-1615(+)